MDANPQAVAELPAEEKPPGRIRHWTKIAVEWIFNSWMSAAVIGAVFLALILATYHSWTRPPDISTVINLMKEEVTAGETRNTALVNRIYLQDAVVTDAACQTPGVSQTWQGATQIDDRYRNLPKVLWLQHALAQVT